MSSDENNEKLNSSNLTSIFGKDINTTDESENNDSKVSMLPIYGSNFFNNKDISPAPQLNIATPASYELGPGDEIQISIWGASENEYNGEVSREGFIKVERIGPVYVSGLTISEAKYKLQEVYQKYILG